MSAVAAPAALQLAAPDLDLSLTLTCGQAFRWVAEPGTGRWAGVVDAHAVVLAHEEGVLRCWATPTLAPERLARYLRLDQPYALLAAPFAAEPLLAAWARRYAGLRLLRQPAWETLCSFVISANNHIPRIRGIVARLAHAYGAPLTAEWSAFPTPAALAAAGEPALRALGLGYRAPYLARTAALVAGGAADLAAWAAVPTPALLAALQTLPGVGPKVAECVALFGYDRAEVFPVDVWIRRAVAAAFGVPDDARAARAVGARYGAHAGLAQQLLYLAGRDGLIPGLAGSAGAARATGGAR